MGCRLLERAAVAPLFASTSSHADSMVDPSSDVFVAAAAFSKGWSLVKVDSNALRAFVARVTACAGAVLGVVDPPVRPVKIASADASSSANWDA